MGGRDPDRSAATAQGVLVALVVSVLLAGAGVQSVGAADATRRLTPRHAIPCHGIRAVPQAFNRVLGLQEST